MSSTNVEARPTAGAITGSEHWLRNLIVLMVALNIARMIVGDMPVLLPYLVVVLVKPQWLLNAIVPTVPDETNGSAIWNIGLMFIEPPYIAARLGALMAIGLFSLDWFA